MLKMGLPVEGLGDRGKGERERERGERRRCLYTIRTKLLCRSTSREAALGFRAGRVLNTGQAQNRELSKRRERARKRTGGGQEKIQRVEE